MDEVVSDWYLLGLSLVVIGGLVVSWWLLAPNPRAKGTYGEEEDPKTEPFAIPPPGVVGGSPPALVTPPARLLEAEDLSYLGSFRVPGKGPQPEQSPMYGGTALCYWPAHDSLLMCGHDHHQWVVEMSIPQPYPTGTVAELLRANELQPYTDLLQGKLKTIDGDTGNGVKIGGITGRGSTEDLVVSVWSYYDAGSPKQTLTHFLVGTPDFSALTPDQVTGPFQIGTGYQSVVPSDTSRIGGFVSGYQCVIPAAYHDALGGTRLTGNGGGVSIVERTSSGPSCSAYVPADVGATRPAPATILMGYPSGGPPALHHPTLGTWGEDGTGLGLYNGTQYFRGMVFPDGTRSVLFLGWRGTSFCYGSGTADEALHETPVPGYPTEVYCYDPCNASKGTHGYPYEACVFAYDADALASVKRGEQASWDVVPYATWGLSLPYDQLFPAGPGPAYMLQGAAWDPSRRWLFVTGYRQDGDAPLVHVFQVA